MSLEVSEQRILAPGVNAVHTLIAVNNIDQSVFINQDRATLNKYWDDVFIQNTVSQDIFDAIANKSGTSNAIRDSIAWTEIPLDFIVDKANLNQTELELRFQYAGSDFFSKDKDTEVAAAASSTASPDAGTVSEKLSPMQEFAKRYRALRMFIQDLAWPRLLEVFRVRAEACNFKKDYPNCKNLDDFLLEYRTGIYDNKKRAMVHVLCNKMWGRECMGMIEKQVMDKLKLRYKHVLISNDLKAPKTRRSGGSIKGMTGRLRQTGIADRFRVIGLTVWKEVIYLRKLAKPMEGVVAVVKVTKATSGYDGFMGLCVGHPKLLSMHTTNSVLPGALRTDTEVAERETSLLGYLEKMAAEGSDMSPSDILAVWSKKQPSTVTIDCETSVSTITNSLSPSGSEKSQPPVAPIEPVTPKTPVGLTASPITTPVGNAAASPKSPASNKTPERLNGRADVATTSQKRKRKPSQTTKGAPKKKAKNSGPPKTPKRNKKSALKLLAPGQQSPERMENGLYCKGCDHKNMTDFVVCEKYRFKEQYLKLKNYPNICAECVRSLAPGTDKTKHCTITDIQQVHCCKNALNHRDHHCVYVLCHECYEKKGAMSSPVRKASRCARRENARRGIALPGE